MIDREPHVSDLRWDRLLAGELPAEERDAANAHAAECAACAARYRELAAGREAFKLRPLPQALAPSRRRARWWWGAPIAALAAAALVLVVPRAEPPQERTKGTTGPSLLVSAGRPDHLAPVATGDVIHPGDYLQAGYSAARPGFGAVLSLDGAGAANAYVPSRGETFVPLAAGVEQSFPESTVLDDVVGRERLVILWCESAQRVAPLVAELRATRAISAPRGCTVRTLDLEKVR